MPRMKGGPHTTNKNWRDGYDEIFGKKEEKVDNPYIIVEKGVVDLEQLNSLMPGVGYYYDACKPCPIVEASRKTVELGAIWRGDLFFNETDVVSTEAYDSLTRGAISNDVRESARRSVQLWCDPYAVITKGTTELFEAMSNGDRYKFLVEHHLISLFQKYSNYWEGKYGMVDFIKEIEEKNSRIDSALYNNAHVVGLDEEEEK